MVTHEESGAKVMRQVYPACREPTSSGCAHGRPGPWDADLGLQ